MLTPSAITNESKDNANSENNEITMDLEKELASLFENEFEDNTKETSQTANNKEEITTARTGRNSCKPLKHVNCTALLLGLMTLQFVNETNFEVNCHEEMSFFKAQPNYDREISKLSDGTDNAFQPLAYQAD